METKLTSPIDVAVTFDIIVKDNEFERNQELTFIITGDDPATNTRKTVPYHLNNREHKSYLDFFAKLAVDFGLRIPENRKACLHHSFIADYHELLTHNLDPSMLYGYGDPSVILVKEPNYQDKQCYYLVSTSNDAPDAFPICRSSNLDDWEFLGFVFPKNKKPRWASEGFFNSDYWAPEIHKINNEFRVYFVARDKNTLELCIGMARSNTPYGPFTSDNDPILKGNMIDPHIFCLDKENIFLYWKEDNNGVWPSRLIKLLCSYPNLTTKLFSEKEDQITASFIQTLSPWIETLKSMEGFLVQQILIEAVTKTFFLFEEKLKEVASAEPSEVQNDVHYVLEVMRTPVYAQKLSKDGSTLVGEKKKVIENDQPWEAHLVEGIWVTPYNSKFYLFYSGNDFSTEQYGIGVAISDTPFGPFNKLPAPILKSTEQWWAPGHPSVAIGLEGQHLLFMHAFFPGKAGYKEFRALLSAPIKFEPENVILDM